MSTNELALLPTESEWNRIKEIATQAVRSGLLPKAVDTPEKAAIIALKGRELGLPPMVSWSHINVIQGKPTMSAEIMLAYIYKDHPRAEIVFAEKSKSKCVIKAKRQGETEFTTFTWDLDRARQMGLLEKDNWKKQPETMLSWRCITEMKRFKFPEVLMGIDYDPTELEEIEEPKVIKTEATVVEVKAPVREVVQEEVFEAEVTEIKPKAEVKPSMTDSIKERGELGIRINEERTRLKWSGADLAQFILDNTGKKSVELTNGEMKLVIEAMMRLGA